MADRLFTGILWAGLLAGCCLVWTLIAWGLGLVTHADAWPYIRGSLIVMGFTLTVMLSLWVLMCLDSWHAAREHRKLLEYVTHRLETTRRNGHRGEVEYVRDDPA